ncbi:odorant receptor 22c-like [Bacillus rossius redtenbacheri]|uniref:odorant receptor 22c-like n=1 Tax=Bacillus rossius redtenbacheri TaxID=93214 RepID=UPI002FDEBA02
MEQEELLTPRTFRFVVGVIRSVGWWPPAARSRGYRAWTAACLLLLAAMFSLHVVHVCVSLGDLRVFAESCCLLLSLLNLWFKVAHMLARQREVARLVERATREVPAALQRRCPGLATRASRRIRALGASFVGLSHASAAFWMLSPAAGRLLDPAATPALPLNTWYPYDALGSPAAYWGTYCLQVCTLCVVVSSYSALSIIYIMLIVAGGARFEMVSELLRSAGEEEAGPTGWAVDSSRGVWVECIDFHQAAFEFVKDLDDVFSPVVLVEFLVCLGIICQAGFLVMVKSKDISDYIKYSGYLGTTVLELLLYCWYANEIVHQSSDVQAAAYDSPWHRGSARHKMAVRMVVARSQKRLCLTAGGMHAISLDTFTGERPQHEARNDSVFLEEARTGGAAPLKRPAHVQYTWYVI